MHHVHVIIRLEFLFSSALPHSSLEGGAAQIIHDPLTFSRRVRDRGELEQKEVR